MTHRCHLYCWATKRDAGHLKRPKGWHVKACKTHIFCLTLIENPCNFTTKWRYLAEENPPTNSRWKTRNRYIYILTQSLFSMGWGVRFLEGTQATSNSTLVTAILVGSQMAHSTNAKWNLEKLMLLALTPDHTRPTPDYQDAIKDLLRLSSSVRQQRTQTRSLTRVVFLRNLFLSFYVLTSSSVKAVWEQ